MEVDRVAGITGSHVVDVDAVGCAPGCGEACRHQSLGGDVSAGDMVARIVQLRGEELVVVNTVDVERVDDISQCRPAKTHSGNVVIRFIAREARGGVVPLRLQVP